MLTNTVQTKKKKCEHGAKKVFAQLFKYIGFGLVDTSARHSAHYREQDFNMWRVLQVCTNKDQHLFHSGSAPPNTRIILSKETGT